MFRDEQPFTELLPVQGKMVETLQLHETEPCAEMLVGGPPSLPDSPQRLSPGPEDQCLENAHQEKRGMLVSSHIIRMY